MSPKLKIKTISNGSLFEEKFEKTVFFFYGGRETWMKMSEVELKITNKLPEAIFDSSV